MTRISDNSALHCCISYNEFGGYCVPLSSRHRPAAQTILSGGVWEPKTIELIANHSKNGDVVHAGAYFGDFLPALSKACVPEAKVWAFEPNPENYRCALITLILNGVGNVELANAGLGSQKGILSMMIADNNGRPLGGASRIVGVEEHLDDVRFTRVAIVKLDEAIPVERPVAVLHLDVEGFEQPALSGALETIKRCKPILILENLPEPEWLAQNILRLGYNVAGKVHDNTVLVDPLGPRVSVGSISLAEKK